MIAANFRRYPDAQLAQLELDLVVEGADQLQRDSFWSWLLKTGLVIDLPGPAKPTWWVRARQAARKLAKAVKKALLDLFDQK